MRRHHNHRSNCVEPGDRIPNGEQTKDTDAATSSGANNKSKLLRNQPFPQRPFRGPRSRDYMANRAKPRGERIPVLLASQCLNHVDARCSQSGYRRGNHSGEQQHDCRTGYRHNPRHFQTAQKAAGELRQPIPGGKAQCESACRHRRALSDHAHQQMPRRRTNRETDSELACPSR